MAARDSISLIALGNGVWLDEIRNEGVKPVRDVPGGSVTFATLGARLFSAKDPGRIRMVFNAGHDFPTVVLDDFRSWSINLDVGHMKDKPSARGLVYYDRGDSNRKGFQRLTEPLPVLVRDLTYECVSKCEAFHFFGSAEYMEEQVGAITHGVSTAEQQFITGSEGLPLVVWEPFAKVCRPDTLTAHLKACRAVRVFSPNHDELGSFFEGERPHAADRSMIEEQARIFVESGIGSTCEGAIVVRAAQYGCLLLQAGKGPIWLPAYYEGTNQKVVDPTGAGNAFLGALAIGLGLNESYIDAVCWGQVAASFAIEQVGLPSLTGSGLGELWNGDSVLSRLRRYNQRVTDAQSAQAHAVQL